LLGLELQIVATALLGVCLFQQRSGCNRDGKRAFADGANAFRFLSLFALSPGLPMVSVFVLTMRRARLSPAADVCLTDIS